MKKISKEEFNKLEKIKKDRYNAFMNRWEIYIKTFEIVGFTKEQAEKLATEFADLKSI